MKKRNTAALWDSLWEGESRQEPSMITFQQEKKSIRWQRIKAHAISRFGTLKKLPVVELGSGMGTYAALFASEGARVTLVDYSSRALDLARQFFKTLRLPATFIQEDIFSFPKSATSSYMISTSCGVAEHFLHKKRTMMLDVHFDVLRPNGVTYIMVPNKLNMPYFTYKTLAEKYGFWPWGEEYPYTRSEFERYCQTRHIPSYGFFGDSFLWSLNYVNPFSLLGKKWRWFKQFNIPQTIPTPLDDRYAYSLGLWAEKKP